GRPGRCRRSPHTSPSLRDTQAAIELDLVPATPVLCPSHAEHLVGRGARRTHILQLPREHLGMAHRSWREQRLTRIGLLGLVLVLLLGPLGTQAELPPDKATLRDKFKQGEEAFERKEFDLAITCFSAVLQAEPKRAAAYRLRGCSHSKKR